MIEVPPSEDHLLHGGEKGKEEEDTDSNYCPVAFLTTEAFSVGESLGGKIHRHRKRESALAKESVGR